MTKLDRDGETLTVDQIGGPTPFTSNDNKVAVSVSFNILLSNKCSTLKSPFLSELWAWLHHALQFARQDRRYTLLLLPFSKRFENVLRRGAAH